MSSVTSISKVLPPKGASYGKKVGRQEPSQGSRQEPSRGVRVQAEEQAEEGFRPWHFFVLASLIAATVAVVMTRQSTPENLVLISLTIGAAGAAAAGFYRMLVPLATEDVTVFREPLTERQRAALEREKTLVLRSIKELEFDRAMGKLSPKDFEEMSGRLRARALSLMKELDEGGSGYREIIERELNARLASVRAGTGTGTGAVRLMPDATDGATVRLKPDTTASRGVGLDRDSTEIGGVRLQPDLRTCGCGTAADADAAFCKRCGARLS